MKSEELVRKLENKELIYGTLICIGDMTVTECISSVGFDLIWIDCEHTPISGVTLQNSLIAAHSGGTPAWVRIPWNDPVLAKPVLDMGAASSSRTSGAPTTRAAPSPPANTRRRACAVSDRCAPVCTAKFRKWNL